MSRRYSIVPVLQNGAQCCCGSGVNTQQQATPNIYTVTSYSALVFPLFIRNTRYRNLQVRKESGVSFKDTHLGSKI